MAGEATVSLLRVKGPAEAIAGTVTVPGDKSISHRALILGALARGPTPVSGLLTAEDCINTARALAQMGVEIHNLGQSSVVIDGVGLRGLRSPAGVLDLGNSGTGMRLLMGVVAGQDFAATLTGDDSLRQRPMDRIAQPLGQMGIKVTGQGEQCLPPVTVWGGNPRPITYRTPMASAQVKSAVLLAGLNAPGTTTVIEPARSRDHTERMLAALGAQVSVDGLKVSVEGNPDLCGCEMVVPGDFSSAAFLLVAALLIPGSEVTVGGILLNSNRTGLLEILGRMGAKLEVSNRRQATGEPVGDITVRASQLSATQVGGEVIPRMLDEVPILALAATQAEGQTVIRDAEELRVKESDRLAAIAQVLSALGATIQQQPDGLVIDGPTRLHGAEVDSFGDHRIAMMAVVAGLVTEGQSVVTNTQCISTSFPEFADLLRDLGARVDEE